MSWHNVAVQIMVTSQEATDLKYIHTILVTNTNICSEHVIEYVNDDHMKQ